MGRRKTEQTLAIEAIHVADLEKGFTRNDRHHTHAKVVAAMFKVSRQRVSEIWQDYDEAALGITHRKASSSKPGSQPDSGPAAGKPDGQSPPSPPVVGLRADRPDLSLVPSDPDLAMWLSMPVEKWTRDDERTLDESERLAATLAYHSFRLVHVTQLQRLIGFDRARWEAMLREDEPLRVRLAAWRAQGVIKKMGKLNELSEYGRDDIALSAAMKLLEQAGGAPDAFSPAVQKLQIEQHVTEERVVFLGEASLFRRPLDMAQRLLDESNLQAAADVIEGEVVEVEAENA